MTQAELIEHIRTETTDTSIFLRCCSRHNLTGKFSLVHGRLKLLETIKHNPGNASMPLASMPGMFDEVSRHILALFIHDNTMYLSFDEDVHAVTAETHAQILGLKLSILDDESSEPPAEFDKSIPNRLLVYSEDNLLFGLEYTPTTEVPFSWGMPWDYEDFDMCLLTHNIINSAERKQIFFDNNKS